MVRKREDLTLFFVYFEINQLLLLDSILGLSVWAAQTSVIRSSLNFWSKNMLLRFFIKLEKIRCDFTFYDNEDSLRLYCLRQRRFVETLLFTTTKIRWDFTVYDIEDSLRLYCLRQRRFVATLLFTTTKIRCDFTFYDNEDSLRLYCLRHRRFVETLLFTTTKIRCDFTFYDN